MMLSNKCQCGSRIHEDLACDTDDKTQQVAQLQDALTVLHSEKLQQCRHIAELRERIGKQSRENRLLAEKLATVIAEVSRGVRSSSSSRSVVGTRSIGTGTTDGGEQSILLLTPKESRSSKNYLEVFRMDYSPGSNESSPVSKRKLSLGAIYEDQNWCDVGRRKDFPSTNSTVSSSDLLIEEASLPDRVQLLVGAYDTHVGIPGVLFRPTKSASGYVLAGKWGHSDVMVGVEPEHMEFLGCVFTNSGRIVTGCVHLSGDSVSIQWEFGQTWTRKKEEDDDN
ncbi:hypothetical protein FOZ61_004404 [Perkinsus olseni]|uniref:Uncharacterized protein n=1 Tax=Perkinsus olseni TaxID=32597 RepID=A0A7J6LYN7_PEROL|nr:hypothetical protein FOZ61_004404 [Perkinsus olseni]KAF4664408.1 hypothetical protein FOL46_004267 [Perkinsus olseni]